MFFSNLRKNIQNQQMNTREVLGESGRTLSNLDSERLNRVMASSLGEERPTSEGLGSLPNIFQPETLMPTINSIGKPRLSGFCMHLFDFSGIFRLTPESSLLISATSKAGQRRCSDGCVTDG